MLKSVGAIARVLAWLLVAGSAHGAPACPATGESASLAPLPHLAPLLKPGQTLEILAAGSGLVAPAAPTASPSHGHGPAPAQQPAAAGGGPGASTGLPWQTAYALQDSVPGVHVSVTAIGHRGQTAAEMLGALRDALRVHPYRLVLWLTGTVDAVQNEPADSFYEALAGGAAAAQDAGADLILIDPQYSRFLEANANLEPYSTAMQAAAALPGVALFHRFDIMRDWAGDGVLDLERTPKADRPATAARLHECLGRELARALVAGAQ